MWGLSVIGAEPYAFIILFGLVYFTWGEIYSLFPATCTDAFGAKYAATNAGLLYTAKGTAAIIGGPMAAALVAFAGSWEMVFWIAAGMDLIAALMAILVLKPMRHGPYRALRRAAAGRAASRGVRPAEPFARARPIARAGEFVVFRALPRRLSSVGRARDL